MSTAARRPLVSKAPARPTRRRRCRLSPVCCRPASLPTLSPLRIRSGGSVNHAVHCRAGQAPTKQGAGHHTGPGLLFIHGLWLVSCCFLCQQTGPCRLPLAATLPGCPCMSKVTISLFSSVNPHACVATMLLLARRCRRRRTSLPLATVMCNSRWSTAPATPRSSAPSLEGRRCGCKLLGASGGHRLAELGLSLLTIVYRTRGAGCGCGHPGPNLSIIVLPRHLRLMPCRRSST